MAVAARGRAELRKAALDALTAFSMRGRFRKQMAAAIGVFGLDQPLPEDVSESEGGRAPRS